MGDVQRTVTAMDLPAGYTVAYGGLYQEQRQSFRELMLVLIVPVLRPAAATVAPPGCGLRH